MNTNLIRNVLGQSDIVWFQIGAFLAFMLLFLVILVWVSLPGSKAYYDKIAIDLVKGD